MHDTFETITAMEASDHLPELLKKVQAGGNFVLTVKGKPIARLVPFREKNTTSIKSIVEGLRNIRKSFKGKFNLRNMIEEGRE